MASKKSNKTLKLKHRVKKLRKDKRIRKHFPWAILLIGVLIGFVYARSQPPGVHPKSLVWAATQDVKVPGDLVGFLQRETNCRDSAGEPKADGVSLWSVFKVSQGKYAKLSYGCSFDLSFYQMAVKEDGDWKLLDRTDYFANNFLPKCAQIDAYKIDKSIEPFCLEEAGTSRENTILAE